MQQLIAPTLYCPFPSQINKYANVLEGYALEWALHFNLIANESNYQHFLKLKGFLLAASVYPDCELEELKIANDWINWLFFWDDQCDMSDLGEQPNLLRMFHKRFIEILDGAELTNQDIPLSYALRNLRQRMIKRGSAKSFYYFILSVEDYFNGCEQEAIKRVDGSILDLKTYGIIRMLCGAVDSVIELIAFCNQIKLPNFIREQEIVRNLKLMTNKIIVLCNDMFSLSKEMASGHITNIVLVLCNQQQISLEEAMKQIVQMHDQEVQALISLEASIPSFGEEVDAELAKYISGMHNWIRGHIDWCSHTARFQTLDKLELVK
ncbi:terpene synthase family protein [Iningainema tapete]|uniref:Terpene synthase n=1 Tax=Iningainema tapete BLCC-T55 TaxID=2748662 RepID=A0A8J6XTW4_9CYAN|nr:terpene synthase [Iningainema tapete]MBD2773803.1 terpene synthase [Iningainema tapete BLCC-T55]